MDVVLARDLEVVDAVCNWVMLSWVSRTCVEILLVSLFGTPGIDDRADEAVGVILGGEMIERTDVVGLRLVRLAYISTIPHCNV